MSKLSVKPLVLGIGAIAVVASSSAILADEVDETLTAQLLADSTHAITDAHEEGGCGEKEGDDEEGKCGEGQCGEDHGEEEEAEEEEEEE